MDTPSTLTERLKLAMKIRSIGQSQLAKRMDVSRTIVNLWLNGKEDISPRRYHQICQILKISLYWLIDGNGPMEPVFIQDELESLIVRLVRHQTLEVRHCLLLILKKFQALS